MLERGQKSLLVVILLLFSLVHFPSCASFPYRRLGGFRKLLSGRFDYLLPLSCKATTTEQGVTLEALTEHKADAKFLREAVKDYLDGEWLQQPIHEDIAEAVSVCYKKERNNGCNDLGEMLVSIGSAMETMDLSQAFVGPWDIGNLASDLIMLRLERELCECAGDLSKYSSPVSPDDNNLDPAVFCTFTVKVSRPYPYVVVNYDVLKEASEDYHDEFRRYMTLRNFLEGELCWEDMHPVIALSMGFRISQSDEKSLELKGVIRQNQEVCPRGWDGMQQIPDLSVITPDNSFIEQKLLNDLPEDEQSTDIIVESMVGLEMYKLTKFSKDPDVQRRYLVGKWLYVQGFLGGEFPLTKPFIPGHMREDNDG